MEVSLEGGTHTSTIKNRIEQKDRGKQHTLVIGFVLLFDALRSTSRRCFQEAKMFTKSRMDVDTPRLRVSLEREGRYYGYLLAKWGYAQCVVNASLIDVTGRKAAHQCTSSQSVGNAKR